MIYICYITYADNVVTFVLTVGDDELTVGDDDDASSEVAGEGHVWECPQTTHVDEQTDR